MEMEHLQDLYLDELRDVYDAEKQLTKALPRMAKAATSANLRKAFENHLKQTQEQVQRLESIFQDLGQKARSKPCKGMQGLIEEGKEMMEEDATPDVKDAALISAAQRVEHYEIAAYGTLSAYAKMLGRKNDLKTLQRTLKEEKQTDEKLTMLAESTINPAAARRSRSSAANRTRQAAGRNSQSSRSRSRASTDGQARGGDTMTKEDLYAKAQELQIQGRSKMGKRELERAVRARTQ